ncbi:hypothetical protein Tco_0519873 [Tanacetum coccineum]
MTELEPLKKLKKRVQAQMAIDEELAKKILEEEQAKAIAEQEQDRINLEDALKLQRQLDKRQEVPSEATQAPVINWNDPSVTWYHAIQHRPRSVAEVRKNMMVFLKNQGGYKMKDFKVRISKYSENKEKGQEVLEKPAETQKTKTEQVEKEISKKARGSRRKSLAKKRRRETLSEESTKKQKLDDDAEKEELQVYLNINSKDKGLDVESLSTRYAIVDWKTQILAADKYYYQIKRADGSIKHYNICSAMLYDFDRQDVLELYRLIMMEPSEEDDIWRNQQDWSLISWKLHNFCGIHVLLMNTGLVIHMMVEKKYPLSQDILSKMLSQRLEVDYQSEIGYDLVRDDGIFIRQDKYVVDILKKFDFSLVKIASIPIETNKALLKDEEAKNVDVHLYRSMIGSLMYLTASRPDIMFVVCACARFQVTPKVSHIYAVKRIFRYLKGLTFSLLALDYLISKVLFEERNTEFHEIVDFLTSSLIHYALTVSPNIYASYTKQFWNTTTSQTVNDVRHIHATIDSKAVVVTEASVRSSFLFNDVNGTACLTNEAIFQNLALMGSKSTSWNEFSTNIASAVICLAINQKFNFSKLIFDGMWRNLDNPKKEFSYVSKIRTQVFRQIKTPLFPSMLVQQAVVEGEGSRHPYKPQPPPSPAHLIIENEVVHQELDDKMVRATTTASLDAQQVSGNISKTQSMAILNEPIPQEEGSVNTIRSEEDSMLPDNELMDNVPPTPYDSPLLRGHTPRSDEGRSNIHDLTAICINLLNRVLALEEAKTA